MFTFLSWNAKWRDILVYTHKQFNSFVPYFILKNYFPIMALFSRSKRFHWCRKRNYILKAERTYINNSNKLIIIYHSEAFSTQVESPYQQTIWTLGSHFTFQQCTKNQNLLTGNQQELQDRRIVTTSETLQQHYNFMTIWCPLCNSPVYKFVLQTSYSCTKKCKYR